MAQKITRGTRKRFEIYITALDGSAENPAGGCEVTLIKQGEYGYDSPKGPYTCKQTGNRGYWGADVNLSPSMTLGSWVAHFSWIMIVGGSEDSAYFNFIVEDKVRPYISKYVPGIRPNIEVVG